MPGYKLIESIVIRIILSAVVVFLSLHVMNDYGWMAFEPTSKMTSIPAGDLSGDCQVITLCIENYSLLPHARVLVNGDIKGEFDNRYVTVIAHNGDIVSVDGTYYNRPFTVKVFNVSGKVKRPRINDVLQLNGNVKDFGKVVVEPS